MTKACRDIIDRKSQSTRLSYHTGRTIDAGEVSGSPTHLFSISLDHSSGDAVRPSVLSRLSRTFGRSDQDTQGCVSMKGVVAWNIKVPLTDLVMELTCLYLAWRNGEGLYISAAVL
jgi:hypothetical protein